MALSFATDIRPLFRGGDIQCMGPSGVTLDDPESECLGVGLLIENFAGTLSHMSFANG